MAACPEAAVGFGSLAHPSCSGSASACKASNQIETDRLRLHAIRHKIVREIDELFYKLIAGIQTE